MAAGESSFPGTGYVTKFGLQLESTTPTVAIPIFAESRTPVCCLNTSFSVFKKMHRSGSRVTAPNCFVAFVNTPPRHALVWAYSPDSSAVRSTTWAFWALRMKNKMIPPLYATWAVTFRARRKYSAVLSRSKITWPKREP